MGYWTKLLRCGWKKEKKKKVHAMAKRECQEEGWQQGTTAAATEQGVEGDADK